MPSWPFSWDSPLKVRHLQPALVAAFVAATLFVAALVAVHGTAFVAALVLQLAAALVAALAAALVPALALATEAVDMYRRQNLVRHERVQGVL